MQHARSDDAWPVTTPPTAGQRLGQRLFRHRTATFVPLALLVVAGAIAVPQTRAEAGLVGLAIDAAALAMLASAAAIRLHVAGRARPGTSSRGVTFEAGELITTGMYARVRNPLYLANLLIWCGLALWTGLAGLAIGVTTLAGMQYHFIVLAEEHYLAGRYRAVYAAYCRRAPRWLPRIASRPLCAETAGPFTWRRAIFREADTLLLLFLGAWLLGLARAGGPWHGAAPVPAAWLVLPAGPAAAWLAVKWLKKSRWKSRARGAGV